MDIQATAICYQRYAVLIQGPAGVGKTSLALQLIERGATLIGDDVVEIFLKNNKLYCQAKETLKGVVEVRGLGLVAGLKVAKAVPLLCVIQLHPKPTERLPKKKEIVLLHKKVPVFDFYACNMTEISVLYAIRALLGELSVLKEQVCAD